MKEKGYSRRRLACYLACLALRLYRYGFVESFNGKLRDECLNESLFIDYNPAGKIIEQGRNDYNDNRPHSSLKGLTPSNSQNYKNISKYKPTYI